MSAADKIEAARALIEPLRATVLWQNANPNVMKAADLLAALADLADAQAQDGWLYHCPDSGLEWSEDHPHESGQCTDATDVRPATVENLKAQLLDSWEAWAEDRERADAQAQEIARLKAIIAKMDANSARIVRDFYDPGVTLSEWTQRQYPELRPAIDAEATP